MKNIISILIVSLAIYSCHSEKKTCKELFDEYYDINIKRCITTMNGVDSLTAAEICACMFDKLYKLDSTFVYLKPKDMEEYVNKNATYISACDSLLNKKTNDWEQLWTSYLK